MRANALCWTVCLGAWLGAAVSGSAADKDPESLARTAQQVLKSSCYRCHGQEGVAEGGFNFVLDRGRLLERKKIVPGEPRRSRLYRRITSSADPMPPAGERPRPSRDEIEAVRRWIEAGAPDFGVPATRRPFVGPAEMFEAIRTDLQRAPERERRYFRYLTLTHLLNAGLSPEELQTYRHGLSKLVNSLSWGRRIVVPRPLGPSDSILRIDLRDYRWTADTWEQVVARDPYALPAAEEAARAGAALAECRQPWVRGDWFVFATSRPPLYHDVLQLPRTTAELEKRLEVDAAEDIRQERVVRAGFNGSGVSRNNRLIERHESSHGAYWKSHDFAGNAGRKNLFEHPLGPTGLDAFLPDGGELIFSLPNGLQGYMLTDGKGERIDRGPTAIVSDPRQPDRAVVNGLSCMSCHNRGMIAKTDQVRAHVRENRSAFARDDVEAILTLYPPAERLNALFEEDARRFQQAVNRCLGKAEGHLIDPMPATEPIAALARLYEEELDLKRTAAEAGVPAESLLAALERAPELARSLGVLKTPGGTVQRQAFVAAFPALAAGLGRRPGSGPGISATGKGPASLVSPAGRHLAWGSGEGRRFVKVWDLFTGEEVLALKGHRDVAYSVAFSPDGKYLASGGWDGVVKLWSLESGREISSLRGHTDEVHSIAFAPDGKRLASADRDGRIEVWDLGSGQSLLSLRHDGGVECVAFSPDGARLASAGEDHAVKLWDSRSGKMLRTLAGHDRPVNALAFSPDGRRLATAGDDRRVKVWDVASGRPLLTFARHKDVVLSVAFSPDGKRIASGGGEQDPAIRVWDAGSGRLLLTLAGDVHAGRLHYVLGLAFSPDGRRLVSADAAGEARVWDAASGKEILNVR